MSTDTEKKDTEKKIFDACCGSKMFYFDKEDERVLFNDRFPRVSTLCDGRVFECTPDTTDDFKNLPYSDNTFDLVIYDPPHMTKAGSRHTWRLNTVYATSKMLLPDSKNVTESQQER